MLRHEKPLDPKVVPAARLLLAERMRTLRQEAGLTFRQLEALTHYHHSTLCLAESALPVPTWEVTRAFVTGCQRVIGRAEDLAVWKKLWLAAVDGQEPQ